MTTQEQKRDDDLDLGSAFRAVRDRYDGTSEESEATLRRALLATRKQTRQRKLTRWVVLPIAATLAASTAWAGVTGRLAPALSSLGEVFHSEHAPHAPPPPSPARSTIAATASKPVEPPAPAEVAIATAEPSPSVTEVAPAAPPTEVAPIVKAPPMAETPKPVAAPAPPPIAAPPPPRATASAPDPNAALFEEAHRLHFQDHDPARALVAWDRYLAAAPNGRFAPEARYNRALTLIRLGRHAEAKPALEAFANGTYGEYRRSEARALLEALARDH